MNEIDFIAYGTVFKGWMIKYQEHGAFAHSVTPRNCLIAYLNAIPKLSCSKASKQAAAVVL